MITGCLVYSASALVEHPSAKRLLIRAIETRNDGKIQTPTSTDVPCLTSPIWLLGVLHLLLLADHPSSLLHLAFALKVVPSNQLRNVIIVFVLLLLVTLIFLHALITFGQLS